MFGALTVNPLWLSPVEVQLSTRANSMASDGDSLEAETWTHFVAGLQSPQL